MRISVGDCRLFVDVEGVGLVPDGPTMRERPTMIVLHGGPGLDHTSFKPAFGALADVAQLIYVDHRGQGRSDRSDPDHWNFAQWADDVAALSDALGLAAPIVYGVSFGSMVALHLAIRHPGRAAKVILDSTSAVPDVDAIVEVFERLGGADVAEVARTFWTDGDGASFLAYLTTCMPLYNRRPQAEGDLVSARSMEHANFALFQHWLAGEQRTMDLRPDLDRIVDPVLLLAGEDDPVTPLRGARLVADALGARCTFETFADCGHGVWRDQPDAAFAAIRRFISC